METQHVSIEILEQYFPGLDWKIHSEISADVRLTTSDRFIDPSISVYRHNNGEYEARLYLADDLQVCNWIDSVTLESALESLRDRMSGIASALQTMLERPADQSDIPPAK
jgi:hypothetical protein